MKYQTRDWVNKNCGCFCAKENVQTHAHTTFTHHKSGVRCEYELMHHTTHAQCKHMHAVSYSCYLQGGLHMLVFNVLQHFCLNEHVLDPSLYRSEAVVKILPRAQDGHKWEMKSHLWDNDWRLSSKKLLASFTQTTSKERERRNPG